MGDEVLLASDIQHLFHIKDYARLNALVDKGKATKKFYYAHGSMFTWVTVLSLAVDLEDLCMFEYLTQHCELRDFLEQRDEHMLSPIRAMNETLSWDPRLQTRRKLEIMCELLLDKWGLLVYSEIRGCPHLRYLADIYLNSFEAQNDSTIAAAWCLQAIRARGADGLGELLVERMQSESAWEYERKIKRTKY